MSRDYTLLSFPYGEARARAGERRENLHLGFFFPPWYFFCFFLALFASLPFSLSLQAAAAAAASNALSTHRGARDVCLSLEENLCVTFSHMQMTKHPSRSIIGACRDASRASAAGDIFT